MFIDLDGFKLVNDTYGHDVGDAVLCAFADCLRSVIRPDDFAARLSGDEFVVHLAPMSDADRDSRRIAAKLMAAMEAPLAAGFQQLRVMPSIEIAAQHGPVYDMADLMRSADEAMCLTKRRQAQALPGSL